MNITINITVFIAKIFRITLMDALTESVSPVVDNKIFIAEINGFTSKQKKANSATMTISARQKNRAQRYIGIPRYLSHYCLSISYIRKIL